MGWVKNGTAAGLLLSLIATGCQNKLYDQNKALYEENKELRAQNDQLHHASAPPPTVTQTPPAAPAVAQDQTAPPPPPQSNVEQIGGLETTVNPRTGNTTVVLPSKLFFDSGQATLRQGAKTSLDQVAAALKKQFAGKNLIVEGHTDSQPIRYSKWKSNQELSVARAKAVKEYLVARGIDPDRIRTRGYGDSKPRSNDMAKNRRVEVVVLSGQ